MSTQEITSNRDQDTLWQILSIWSLTAIPMRISSWIVYHAVAHGFDTYPLGSGVARIGLLTIGLAWLLVLSLLIAGREEGDFRRGVRQMGWGRKRHDLPLLPPAPALGEHGIQQDRLAVCFDRQALPQELALHHSALWADRVYAIPDIRTRSWSGTTLIKE